MADRHQHAVILGDPGEGGSDFSAVGVTDRRHSIESPGVGQAAEFSADPVEAVDQMRLGHGRGEHPPAPPTRMRERSDQQICGLAPPAPRGGWVRQLDPVPLVSAPAGWSMTALGAVGRARAGLADGPELALPDLAGQRLIRGGVAEVFEFVAQGPCPQMRILGQTSGDVVDERFERILTSGFTDAGGWWCRSDSCGSCAGFGRCAGRSPRSSSLVCAVRGSPRLPPMST